jgi:histidinol-phosphate aminotransferase
MLAGMYLYRKLLEKKILVRDYTSHPVLQGCLRITVGLPLENAEIISAYAERRQYDAAGS